MLSNTFLLWSSQWFQFNKFVDFDRKLKLKMVSAFKVSASNLRVYKKGSTSEICEAIPYI